MGSLAGNEERADDLRFIKSSADTKIVALKRELVVQLFTRDGPFWEAVRDVRDRWRVEASAQLPPHPVRRTLSPPGLPDPQKELEEWLDTSEAWSKDLESIARSVIPERYIGNKFRPDWGSFVSVCVWCDPPAPELLAFADLGGPWAVSLPLESGEEHPDGTPIMTKSPIVEGDPLAEKRIEEDHWRTLLEKVVELYLQPHGHALDEVLAEVHRRYPEIEARRTERLNQTRRRGYVYVDEWVAANDDRLAVSMLVKRYGSHSSGGAPERDRLVAVECAVLHNRHNSEDPEDRRRKKWTYESLREKHGWRSTNTAKEYVKLGLGILRRAEERLGRRLAWRRSARKELTTKIPRGVFWALIPISKLP